MGIETENLEELEARNRVMEVEAYTEAYTEVHPCGMRWDNLFTALRVAKA